MTAPSPPPASPPPPSPPPPPAPPPPAPPPAPASALRDVLPPLIDRCLREAPWTFASIAKKDPLKEACRHFIALAAAESALGSVVATDDALVDAAIEVTRLACGCGAKAASEPALDALDAIAASGDLRGASVRWAKALDARGDAEDAAEEDAASPSAREAAVSELVAAVAKCAEGGAASTQRACVRALTSTATSDVLHLRGDALATATRALVHVAVAAAGGDADQCAAKASLTRLINVVFERAEAHFDPTPAAAAEKGSESSSSSPPPPPPPPPRHARVSDALLVLLVLCKIASRDLEGASTASDVYIVKARVLTLDILRQLLEGPSANKWLATLKPRLSRALGLAILRGARGVDGAGETFEVLGGDGGGGGGGGGGAGGGTGTGTKKRTKATTPAAATTKAAAPLPSLARGAFGVLVLRARAHWKPEIAALFPPLALEPLEAAAGSIDAGTQIVALRLVRKARSTISHWSPYDRVGAVNAVS